MQISNYLSSALRETSFSLKNNALPVMPPILKKILVVSLAIFASIFTVVYVITRFRPIPYTLTTSDGTIKQGNLWATRFWFKAVQNKVTFPDGTIEIGNFKNGKLDGIGHRQGKNVELGEFKNGQLYMGELTDPLGNVFTGEFENDENGDAKLVIGKTITPTGG